MERVTRDCPPRALEALVELFFPPATRQEKVGDLRERYVGDGRYLFEAANLLFNAIRRGVLRSFNRLLFTSELCILILAFGLNSAVEAEAAVIVLTLLVLTLCDSYGYPAQRTLKHAVYDGIAVAGFMVSSQLLFSWIAPALLLSRSVLFRGAVTSLIMLLAVRLMFRRTTDGLQPLQLQSPSALRLANIAWLSAALIHLDFGALAVTKYFPYQDLFAVFMPIAAFAAVYRMENDQAYGLARVQAASPVLCAGSCYAISDVLVIVCLALPIVAQAALGSAGKLRIAVEFAALAGLASLRAQIRRASQPARTTS